MSEIIVGMDAFNERLKRLGVAMEKAALIEAVNVGADIVRNAAAANAPRHTGKLAGSMVTKLSTKTADVIAYIGPRRQQFYGLFVEKGTKERVDKKGRHSGRVAATHFLSRSLQSNRDRIVTAMKQALQNAINKAAH